jgi:hypothetical protein
MDFTSALTPALSPEERESQLQSLDNLAAIVAVAALLLITPKSRRKLRVFVSLKPGPRFTLSLGERAGVAAQSGGERYSLPVTSLHRKNRGTTILKTSA